MMLCEWTGTCSVAARPAALLSRGTLKAITCGTISGLHALLSTLPRGSSGDRLRADALRQLHVRLCDRPNPLPHLGGGFGYCGGRGGVPTGPTLPRHQLELDTRAREVGQALPRGLFTAVGPV